MTAIVAAASRRVAGVCAPRGAGHGEAFDSDRVAAGGRGGDAAVCAGAGAARGLSMLALQALRPLKSALARQMMYGSR